MYGTKSKMDQNALNAAIVAAKQHQQHSINNSILYPEEGNARQDRQARAAGQWMPCALVAVNQGCVMEGIILP